MKKKKIKVLKLLVLTFILVLLYQTVSFAHSGRTDSRGGHKDKNNKSGLGSYHYHCGGHEAHLHSNGVCPYASNSTKSSSSSNTSKSTKDSSSSNTSKSTKDSSSSNTSISTKSNSSSNTSDTIKNNSMSNSSNSLEKSSTTSTLSSKSSIASEVIKTQDNNQNISTEPELEESKKVEVTVLEIKNKEKNVMKVGEKFILELNIEPIDAVDKLVTWISSDTRIATVNLNGEVEAKAEGNVKIIAKANNGKEDSIDIVIQNPQIEVTQVNLDKKDISLIKGEYAQITEIVYPLNATDKTVKWESSDESIVTVENGKVTAIKEGKATITAISNNGIKGMCYIDVKNIQDQTNNEKKANVKDEEISDSTATTLLLGIMGLPVLGIATLGIGGTGLAIGLKNKGKH